MYLYSVLETSARLRLMPCRAVPCRAVPYGAWRYVASLSSLSVVSDELRPYLSSHEAQILQVPLPVILAKPLSKQRKALAFVKPNQSRIRLTIQIDQCASDLVLHIAELIHGHCLMTDTIISRPSFRFREV